MTIQIDKTFPIMPINKWPFKEMQVGDSFAAPSGVEAPSFRGIASRAGKDLGWKFSVRATPDGLRCWRVE